MNNLTPKQEQTSRDEFEAHFKTFGARFQKNLDGHYEAEYVQAMWVSWKARHRTIRVELPNAGYSTQYGEYVSVSSLIESLQAAGIGVKS